MVAIFCYLLIIVSEKNTGYGCISFISIPLFLWITKGLLGFQTTAQVVYAYLAIIGLAIHFINLNSIRTLKVLVMDMVSFALLASPVIYVILVLDDFNLAIVFIQLTLCLITYSISLYYSIKQLSLQKL